MAGPRHVVLLDGLVERGLAEEQEAQANPRGQQPGHGGTEPGGVGGVVGWGERWERWTGEACYEVQTLSEFGNSRRRSRQLTALTAAERRHMEARPIPQLESRGSSPPGGTVSPQSKNLTS